ncbi:unnamed protein product [Leuciscus chuanchicus]
MEENKRTTESEIAAHLNDIARLNLLIPGDVSALNYVIMDYFTSRDVDEGSDDEVTEEEESDEDDDHPVIEDVAQVLPPAAVQDDDEDEIQEFVCTCKHNGGYPCSTRFKQEELQMIRCCYLEMTREELDIAILAKLSCGMHLSQLTSCSRKKEQTSRKSQRTDFFHHGKKICRDTFKYLHTIGQDKLNVLIKHYKEHSVTPCIHGNKKRQPPNALKKDDNVYVAHFIFNYAETHGIHLPGRVPGFWRSDLKLLPTNCTKAMVYSDYCVAVAATNRRVVSVVTFRRIWREVAPFIVTMRPATDLCWTCQKYQKHISEAANRSDAEKATLHRLATDHLEKARIERSYYQQLCKDSKANLPAELELGPSRGFEGMTHYSMDFAQQIHYPSNPLQPGPIDVDEGSDDEVTEEEESDEGPFSPTGIVPLSNRVLQSGRVKTTWFLSPIDLTEGDSEDSWISGSPNCCGFFPQNLTTWVSSPGDVPTRVADI